MDGQGLRPKLQQRVQYSALSGRVHPPQSFIASRASGKTFLVSSQPLRFDLTRTPESWQSGSCAEVGRQHFSKQSSPQPCSVGVWLSLSEFVILLMQAVSPDKETDCSPKYNKKIQKYLSLLTMLIVFYWFLWEWNCVQQKTHCALFMGMSEPNQICLGCGYS